jgi:hypothetical protein
MLGQMFVGTRRYMDVLHRGNLKVKPIKIPSSLCPTTIDSASAACVSARLLLAKACPVVRENET